MIDGTLVFGAELMVVMESTMEQDEMKMERKEEREEGGKRRGRGGREEGTREAAA